MNFRPTSLAPLSIPLLLALLLQLNSSFASTASVLSINRPSQEDTPIEKTNLNKHAACGDDCNDEYIENWYASILYPKLKTGNHEPEIFYWGDTMVVNYISSFDDPILNIYCYQDEAHTTENGSWALNDNDVPAYNGTIPVTLEFSFPQGFNVTGCEIQLTGRTPGDSVYASIVQSESVPFKFIDHHRDGPALVFSMTGVVTEGSGSDTGSTTSTTLSTVSLPTASSTSSLDRGATTTSTQTQTSSAEPISKEESKAGASLGATALAGIGAGAGVAVVAIAAICFFFFWRARQKGRKGAADADEPAPNSVSEHKEAKVKVEELHGQAVAERGELYSPEKPQELGSGTQRHEIGGGRSMERIELP